MSHPPGEPPAKALAEERSDVVVIDGPCAGRIYTFDGDKGGYLPTDPKVCMDEPDPLVDIGAVLLQCQAEIVRPVQEEE